MGCEMITLVDTIWIGIGFCIGLIFQYLIWIYRLKQNGLLDNEGNLINLKDGGVR